MSPLLAESCLSRANHGMSQREAQNRVERRPQPQARRAPETSSMPHRSRARWSRPPRARRPSRRWWRDVRRRRLLALADCCAVGLGLAHRAPAGARDLDAGLLPVWILVAKLAGLYDADHRAMRHLTVDEAADDLRLGGDRSRRGKPARRADPGRLARHRRDRADRGDGDRRRFRAPGRRPRRLAGEHAARAGPDRRRGQPRARDAAEDRAVQRPPHDGCRARGLRARQSTGSSWHTSGSTRARSP